MNAIELHNLSLLVFVKEDTLLNGSKNILSRKLHNFPGFVKKYSTFINEGNIIAQLCYATRGTL